MIKKHKMLTGIFVGTVVRPPKDILIVDENKILGLIEAYNEYVDSYNELEKSQTPVPEMKNYEYKIEPINDLRTNRVTFCFKDDKKSFRGKLRAFSYIDKEYSKWTLRPSYPLFEMYKPYYCFNVRRGWHEYLSVGSFLKSTIERNDIREVYITFMGGHGSEFVTDPIWREIHLNDLELYALHDEPNDATISKLFKRNRDLISRFIQENY